MYGTDIRTNKKLRSFRKGKMKVGKDGWLPVNRKTGIDITGEFEIQSPESLLLISDNNNPTHGILILQGVSKVRSDFLLALIIKKNLL